MFLRLQKAFAQRCLIGVKGRLRVNFNNQVGNRGRMLVMVEEQS